MMMGERGRERKKEEGEVEIVGKGVWVWGEV